MLTILPAPDHVAAYRLSQTLTGEDLDAIKAKSEALQQASMKLGEALYGGQQAGAGAGPEGSAEAKKPGGDNVVDADFEEVKDDKKKSA